MNASGSSPNSAAPRIALHIDHLVVDAPVGVPREHFEAAVERHLREGVMERWQNRGRPNGGERTENTGGRPAAAGRLAEGAEALARQVATGVLNRIWP